MINLKTFTTLFTCFCLAAYYAPAQDAATQSVILVQLRSEHNRIEALKKARRNRDIAEVERDAHAVQKRMKMDFHNNITAHTVYYYMDTNAALVKQKMFDGVLCNEDGTLVKNAGAIAASGNYVIVYYGYPVEQGRKEAVVTDPEKYRMDKGERNGRGLVILNKDFLQVGYVYKLGMAEIEMSEEKKAYYYASKHYDIEYYPLAQKLADKLNRLALQN